MINKFAESILECFINQHQVDADFFCLNNFRTETSNALRKGLAILEFNI